jgi:hypothetical protein
MLRSAACMARSRLACSLAADQASARCSVTNSEWRAIAPSSSRRSTVRRGTIRVGHGSAASAASRSSATGSSRCPVRPRRAVRPVTDGGGSRTPRLEVAPGAPSGPAPAAGPAAARARARPRRTTDARRSARRPASPAAPRRGCRRRAAAVVPVGATGVEVLLEAADDLFVEGAAQPLVGAEHETPVRPSAGRRARVGRGSVAQHRPQPELDGAVVVGQRRERPLVLADAHGRERLHRPDEVADVVSAVSIRRARVSSVSIGHLPELAGSARGSRRAAARARLVERLPELESAAELRQWAAARCGPHLLRRRDRSSGSGSNSPAVTASSTTICSAALHGSNCGCLQDLADPAAALEAPGWCPRRAGRRSARTPRAPRTGCRPAAARPRCSR